MFSYNYLTPNVKSYIIVDFNLRGFTKKIFPLICKFVDHLLFPVHTHWNFDFVIWYYIRNPRKLLWIHSTLYLQTKIYFLVVFLFKYKGAFIIIIIVMKLILVVKKWDICMYPWLYTNILNSLESRLNCNSMYTLIAWLSKNGGEQ
jgi:hypothetical protein